MADAPFRSAWLKLAWGIFHAQTLHNEVIDHAAKVGGNELVQLGAEYDPTAHCIKILVKSVQPPPADWSLRLGDIVNNFRACLDHVAWELVQRGSAWPLPPSREKSVYFPIAESREKFDALCLGQLPGLRYRDKAVVRKVQPYIGGKRNLWRHALTPIPEMTSVDKHRELRPVWIAPMEGQVQYGTPIDCVATRVPQMDAARVVLEPEAEIHRIYVRKTGPNPMIELQANLTCKPVVPGPIWLDNWLKETGDWLNELLMTLSKPPEDLRKVWPGLKLRFKPSYLTASQK
jgi:hypothetical protein